MKTFGNIAFGAIAILSLPVVLPSMVIRNMFDKRAQKRIACHFVCTGCGELLGDAAVTESNRLVAEEWAELQAKRPGIKFRRIRSHDAICMKCGQAFLFSNQGKTYLPVTTKMKKENKAEMATPRKPSD